jgi:NAD(P)-dependent dehydrogenase (short-subunit alcohol dehydrogenase family)
LKGRLEGKVVLVTGGGSGIGRASSLRFAREGAKVIIADIAVGGGKETVKMIEEAGGQAFFIKADVSVAAEVEVLIHKAVETYGRLDCAHNNAGGSRAPTLPRSGPTVLTADLTEEAWDYLLNNNLRSTWLCMKYEIPQMIRQGGGAIVNTSSVAGLKGSTKTSAYGAAKHGIIGLTKTSALEYGRSGIRINAVCPGPILTPSQKHRFDADPQAEKRYIDRTALAKWGTPEDVAEAVVWLCSDAATFVTGIAMPVDGGVII